MNQAFEQNFTTAGDLGTLRRRAYDYFYENGIRRLSYHHYPPLGAVDYGSAIIVVALGFPEGWVKSYSEQRMYEFDPIIRYAMSATRPFWWDSISELTHLSNREADYVGALKTANLGAGLAVPVYGPHGRNGYFGLGFGETTPDVSASKILELQSACQLIHLQYCMLLARTLGVEISLSVQEVSVLKLVAQGRTNSEISDALNISNKTVETYIRRSFDKLDVSDRMTAALRALSLGLLD
jgi:LuxR family transcriptional regulator/LuxR family quorum-sensing system transcriptional regulator CciR